MLTEHSKQSTVRLRRAPALCLAGSTKLRGLRSTSSYVFTNRSVSQVTCTLSAAARLAPLRPDEVWYFAYGSNMNPKVLTNRRMVRPRQSVPCKVPDHSLSFGMLGFPYAEPGFATIVQHSQGQQVQNAHLCARSQKQSVSKPMSINQGDDELLGHCVHGVLHRIRKREWDLIQATEGVNSRGLGYQVAEVKCHLYDGITAVDALTLKSAAMAACSRQVLPSQRYLQLLQEGARYHHLDASYQQWLTSLQAYQPASVLQQAVGSMAYAAVLTSMAATSVPVYVSRKAMASLLKPGTPLANTGAAESSGDTTPSLQPDSLLSTDDDAETFFSWYASQAQDLAWWVHDNMMSPILGSGCNNDKQQV